MTVSVVIPSHNNAALLAKSLAAFVAQRPHGLTFEVIVVDNNSGDDAIAALQLAFRDKLTLTVVLQPRLSHPFALCRARNIGIRLARGEWIVSMDADTIPNTNYLKNLGRLIAKWGDKPVIAACERHFVSADHLQPEDIMRDASLLEALPRVASPSNYDLPQDRRLPAMEQLPHLEHPWDYMHGCNVIYRREDALKINGYHEAYDGRWGFEDIDFAYRMITQAYAQPLYARGLHVYHQDIPEEKSSTNRTAKSSNPNWARICELIPGYKEYKVSKYRQLSDSIEV